MLALALVAAFAFQQDNAILDVPVYRSAELRVSLPRPFDDWVFSADTGGGTTTVIFQPRAATLSDQLWGALVVANFGRPLDLSAVVDRRIATTWRRTFGSSYRLVTRDALTLDGIPAVHLVMRGLIERAALDVEEYLIVRRNELVALQFRYPRGIDRDSLAAGYLRSLAGFQLTGSNRPAVILPARALVQAAISGGSAVFDAPDSLDVIASGLLSSSLASQGRRQTRFRALVGDPDTSLYAVGHYRADVRRAGRLTIRIWRNASRDTAIARVTDSILPIVAEAWETYWQDFGMVPTTEVALVETAWHETRGGAATLFIGADVRSPDAPMILRRELSRTWWGSVVRADSTSAFLVRELLPPWSSTLAIGAPPGADALSRARLRVGEARFREAIQTLVAESRDRTPAIAAFYRVLGDSILR